MPLDKTHLEMFWAVSWAADLLAAENDFWVAAAVAGLVGVAAAALMLVMGLLSGR